MPQSGREFARVGFIPNNYIVQYIKDIRTYTNRVVPLQLRSKPNAALLGRVIVAMGIPPPCGPYR